MQADEDTAISEFKNEMEIIFIPGYQITLQRLPNLKCVHNFYIGCEKLLAEPFKESVVLLSNSYGASSIPITEFVISCCLYFYKHFEHFEKLKGERIWNYPAPHKTLTGKTILIVGMEV